MARTVTIIPQTINPLTHTPTYINVLRKVAAYARVSTDSEEQLTSYEAQVDYYTKYIKAKPEWEFVKVYTDEGITAVNTKGRDGFKQMIQDALDGKIDLIITKSVSRFARNTVDSLVTVRKLKEKGVEVYFEKENIYTLDSKGELLITIMSSLAQEESRSISENVTWGQRKRFADGKVSLPYKSFLGYEKGEDDIPKIVEAEAAIVRKIYGLFMDGLTPCAIARQFTADTIPTPAGKEKWQTSTVLSILTNEKYKGAALLQKGFTVDFLTKKRKVNEGEVPQYYVEHSHEAIIDPLEFELVQSEILRRKKIGRNYSGNSIFSSRLICGDCGQYFGSKVWQSNTKYRKRIWRCNDKYKKDTPCNTPHITEDEIQQRFLKAYNSLITNKDELLEDCRVMQEVLTDFTDIKAELDKVLQEIEVVTELTRKCINENTQTVQNQTEYQKHYNDYVERYNKLKTKAETLKNQQVERQRQNMEMGAFMFEIMESENVITEFDKKLWVTTIEHATIHNDGRITFRFKNGAEIEA